MRTLLVKTFGIDEEMPCEGRETVLTGSEAVHALDYAERLPRLMRDGANQTAPELQVKGTLGEGGMGLVELAEQLSVGREVAVKKVREAARSEQATLTLLREGWTTGYLEHPNIVPVYTLGRDEQGDAIIVMKRISGTSWLEVIEDPSRVPEGFDGSDPLELHVEILSQVCNAVHFAHSRGIIHRDLKPENVMLGGFGEVYVLDWGIAVSLTEDHGGRFAQARDVKTPAGTPVYMAPEMVEADGEELGVHTDVFLLGAILYDVLAGRPPFAASTVMQAMLRAHRCEPPPLPEGAPAALVAICERAMSREPGERYESAGALREALQDYRHRRQSRRLALEGEERSRELAALLHGEERGEEVDEGVIYRTFGECRFAFEQALKIHADTSEAQVGLEAALVTMAHRELSQGALKSAAVLIAEIKAPPPELSRRYDELAAEVQARQEEYEELQQLRHDADVEVGRRGRALFLLVMGSAWVLVSVVISAWRALGIRDLTPEQALWAMVALTLVLVAVLYRSRRRFFTNDLNRRLLLSVVAACLSVILLRACIVLWGIAHEIGLSAELVVYTMGTAVMGITMDRRIFLATAIFGAAAVVTAFWLPLTTYVYTASHLLTVAGLIWVWRDGSVGEAPDQSSGGSQ